MESHFLLESLAACHNTKSKLVIYITVNTAFINYLDNLINSLKFPLLLKQTTIYLQSFNFDPDLLKSPKTLKDFVHQFQHKKEISDLQRKHSNDIDMVKKKSLFNNYIMDGFFCLLLLLFH